MTRTSKASGRRAFLAAAGTFGVALVATRRAAAQTSAAPSPAPPPSAKHDASDVARAIAERMRRFDPTLSAAELAIIATGVDAGRASGARIDPGGRRLHNGDGPVTRFSAERA